MDTSNWRDSIIPIRYLFWMAGDASGLEISSLEDIPPVEISDIVRHFSTVDERTFENECALMRLDEMERDEEQASKFFGSADGSS